MAAKGVDVKMFSFSGSISFYRKLLQKQNTNSINLPPPLASKSNKEMDSLPPFPYSPPLYIAVSLYTLHKSATFTPHILPFCLFVFNIKSKFVYGTKQMR